jgi:hypothetical protein
MGATRLPPEEWARLLYDNPHLPSRCDHVWRARAMAAWLRFTLDDEPDWLDDAGREALCTACERLSRPVG